MQGSIVHLGPRLLRSRMTSIVSVMYPLGNDRYAHLKNLQSQELILVKRSSGRDSRFGASCMCVEDISCMLAIHSR